MIRIVLLLLLFCSQSQAGTYGGGLADYYGNGITSEAFSTFKNPLDIEIIFSGSSVDPRARTWTLASGTDSASCTQSTPGLTANGWPVKPTDGTNIISIKPASTSAVVADTAQVVALSPNTSTPSFTDNNKTGTLAALNATVQLPTNGMGTVILTLTGTFVATVNFSGFDGTNWIGAPGLTLPAGGITTALVSPGSVAIPVGGFSQFRVQATTYTSGTVNVFMNAGAGLNVTQVFNDSGSPLVIKGNGTAGTPDTNVVTVQGITSGQPVIGNITQLGGNTINTGAGATGTGTARVAANIYDGSGNAITSTTITGTAANKQPLDINTLTSGTGKYFTTFSLQQTAATAVNAAVFSMRNAAASTKTVLINNVFCRMGFNPTNPVTRTQQQYVFQRYSAATPTGGTALTAAQGDSSDGASQVTDIRFLDTGLTTTGVTFVANNLATMACDTTQGSTCQGYMLQNDSSAWKLAPGEGLIVRLGVAAVTGTAISCNIGWREQ